MTAQQLNIEKLTAEKRNEMDRHLHKLIGRIEEEESREKDRRKKALGVIADHRTEMSDTASRLREDDAAK